MKVKYLLGIAVILAVIAGAVVFFSLSRDSDKPLAPEGDFHLLYEITGGAHKLKDPVYALADKKGRIFVADAGNRVVKVFNKEGQYLFEFGGPGSEKTLVYPYGIGIIDDNRIIVTDLGAGAIYEFSATGAYVKTWLAPGKKSGPAAVSVSPEKRVYITDMNRDQVLVFSENGKLERKIKPRRVGLRAPQGLAANKDGTVWVADGGNYNIKLLKPDGGVITAFDGGPAWPLSTVKGIAVDEKGKIYAADTLAKTVRIFDKNGADIGSFGWGREKKESSFLMPTGLSVDNTGRIYVADQGRNSIQVWTWK